MSDTLSVGANQTTGFKTEVVCAEVAPTLNTTWGHRSPGSQAQEWDSERGGRFVMLRQPSREAGEEFSDAAKAEGKIR